MPSIIWSAFSSAITSQITSWSGRSRFASAGLLDSNGAVRKLLYGSCSFIHIGECDEAKAAAFTGVGIIGNAARGDAAIHTHFLSQLLLCHITRETSTVNG